MGKTTRLKPDPKAPISRPVPLPKPWDGEAPDMILQRVMLDLHWHGWTQVRIAKELGVVQSVVSCIVTQESKRKNLAFSTAWNLIKLHERVMAEAKAKRAAARAKGRRVPALHPGA